MIMTYYNDSLHYKLSNTKLNHYFMYDCMNVIKVDCMNV